MELYQQYPWLREVARDEATRKRILDLRDALPELVGACYVHDLGCLLVEAGCPGSASELQRDAMAAIGAGKLRVKNARGFYIDRGAVPEHPVFEHCLHSDIDHWLQAEGQPQRASARQPVATRHRRDNGPTGQDATLQQILRDLGYPDDQPIPKRPGGTRAKTELKARARARALAMPDVFTPRTFRSAWERLLALRGES